MTSEAMVMVPSDVAAWVENAVVFAVEQAMESEGR